MAAPIERTGYSSVSGPDDSEPLVSEQEIAPAGPSRWWKPTALLLALACAVAGAIALGQRHRSTAAVRPGAVLRMSQQDLPSYGQDTCPCIAIDQISGQITVDYNGVSFDYPADVGARCEAWDGTSDPACTGDATQPSYCEQPWCYVDPCNCQGLDVPPKTSAYFPDAMFQGKAVHFSYVTCGGTDSWSSDEAKKAAQAADNEALCTTEADPTIYGDAKCKCIGVEGRDGTVNVAYGAATLDFPVDVGSKCETWDKENDPACKGDAPPDYCEKAWCYVDPCDCDLSAPSKAAGYFPSAKHAGRPVHYSYLTCGAEDTYSSDEAKKQAAENQMSC